jgi:hypothetical protein
MRPAVAGPRPITTDHDRPGTAMTVNSGHEPEGQPLHGTVQQACDHQDFEQY